VDKKWDLFCEIYVQSPVQKWDRQIIQTLVEKQDSSENKDMALANLA
jgi:hypothetical protein